MMSCQELTRVVTEYLEGTLPWHRRLAIRLHLMLCRHCTEYVRQLREMIRALGAIPDGTITPQVRADLLDVFDRRRQ